MYVTKERLHKAAVLVAGVTIILLGLVMSVPLVPGPGILVIGLGFALLATKFPWAKKIWTRIQAIGRRLWMIAKIKFRRWWHGPAREL